MGVNFFQNGASIGSTAGWGGYTGGNNYVVRYDFVTPSQGASAVSIALSNIFYGNNAGTQGFGFKISAQSAAYANARNTTPDSGCGYMSYTGSNGYCCTLTASGLNLSPNTTYYLFVFVATAGAEYYSGWNCVSPVITLSGSYSQPRSTISSLSSRVETQSAVSIIMNRSGSCWHKASFTYGSEMLAVSAPFAASLSYTCPREWMEKDLSALSLPVSVSVQTYTDAACTAATGAPATGSFVLSCDGGMRPVLSEGAAAAAACNTGAASSFTDYIAGISRARVSFQADKISLASCAGAGIAGYRLSYRGRKVSSESTPVDTGVIAASCTLECAVIDTRGRESSVSLEIDMLPYVPPSLSSISAARCTSSGADDEKGAYYKIKAALSFTSLDGKNSAAVSAALRAAGSGYGEETALGGFESGVWSSEWASPAVLGGNLTGDSYTLRLTVTDAVGGKSEYTRSLYHSEWAVKLNSDGTALGVGMAPTVQNAVQMPDDWRLYAGVLVLSENSYGATEPSAAVTDPVEGQVYLYLTETE